VRLSRKALPDCQQRHAIVARETAASHVARLIKGLDQGLCRSIDQANPGGTAGRRVCLVACLAADPSRDL
jgi:hypothetical protein